MEGGRAAPLLAVNKPKKTGARSERARTRGQNPLVINNIINRPLTNVARLQSFNIWEMTEIEA